MFAIQSAKELADHLEKKIFKDTNSVVLKSQDPESVWEDKLKAEQPAITIKEDYDEELKQKTRRRSENTKCSKQIVTINENILEATEEKQNIKNETGSIGESFKQITNLKPFFNKIRVAFSKYVIENVSLSASKIRDLIRDRYEEVNDNSIMELEESQGSLDQSTKWRSQKELLNSQQNSNMQFEIEENSAYWCQNQYPSTQK